MYYNILRVVFVLISSLSLIYSTINAKLPRKTKNTKLHCPVKDYSLNYQVGRFVIHPYPERFKPIAPTSRFDVLDCYVVLSNHTKYALKVTYFHRKDGDNGTSNFIAVPEGKSGTGKLAPYLITGFALPRVKWCELLGTGGASPGKARLVEVLKSAPVAGFALTRAQEPIPTLPQYMLPQERKNFPTYFFDILVSKHDSGFEVKEASGYAR